MKPFLIGRLRHYQYPFQAKVDKGLA
ncbi:uncharacterized protein METZ01_LOCUS470293, partial [marine metagenome]